MRILGPSIVSLTLVGCFPTLPNVGALDDMKILSIQADPATPVLSGFGPPPPVRVTAATVDPDDDALTGTTFSWSIETGDEDFDALLRPLLPANTQTPSILLDLTPIAFLGYTPESGEWTAIPVPLTVVADNGETRREAVKLVQIVVPTPQDDAGGTGARAGHTAGWRPLLDGPPATDAWNANPRFLSLSVGATTWTRADLPRRDGFVLVGPVAPEDGLSVVFTMWDDKDVDDLDVSMYWTVGSPGVPGEVEVDRYGWGGGEEMPTPEREVDPDEPQGDWQDNYGLDIEGEEQAVGWTPPPSRGSRTPRIVIVLKDDQGGQDWVELRPE